MNKNILKLLLRIVHIFAINLQTLSDGGLSHEFDQTSYFPIRELLFAIWLMALGIK